MFKRMTDKKQGENQCERPSMKGFPWNVLVGAFIGIFVVQIWGAKKVETRSQWLSISAPGFMALFLGCVSLYDRLDHELFN